MDKAPKWIRFEPMKSASLTDVWAVKTVSGREGLGIIKWYGPWRKYCFWPDHSLFEEDCLRDIANFCETETRNYKEKRKVAANGG